MPPMRKSPHFMRVSANVRYYREKSGISQLDLALEIGIKSVVFYSNCKNNRYGKHFNLEHIYKLSKAIQIPISALFEPFIKQLKIEHNNHQSHKTP